MKTLEQILEYTKKAPRGGEYGLDECKDSIEMELRWNKDETLYTLLEKYVKRANEDIFFNKIMIQACWQMINNR